MSQENDNAKAGEAFQFKAEIQQLLNILVHSLYTEKEIFLRELLSNASDALNRVQFELLTNHDALDPDAELAIHVSVDEEARTITISDSGTGMTREEIARDLGTIAHSGASAFLKELEEDKRPLVELIGQFGVGFYSVFMVAEEVRVTSRSFRPDAKAVEWISDGGDQYTLKDADKQDRGTRIEVKLTEDAAGFANIWTLERTIKKHSDYVAFPIYVGDKDEAVNRQTALWRQSAREVTQEEYDEFYKHLTLDFQEPLLHTHLVTDAPVDIRSILYIPAQAERSTLTTRSDHGLKLYIRNVLIEEYNKDLLPNHFRFVEGVVESEDLPLNISRETVQSSPVARRVQRALSRKLIKELVTLADEKPEVFATFWNEYGPFMKEGIAADPGSKDDLLPLLRFHSTKSAKALVSVAQYLEHMPEEQDAIYYVLGEDLSSVARSPHLDYFKAHDIEVLYLVDAIDTFMTPMLGEHEGKAFKNVDDADLDLPQEAEADEETANLVPEADFNRLVGRFVKVLDERVVEVRESKVLKDSPCRLVSPSDDGQRDMSRMYRMLGQEYQVPKRILEINRGHSIIANLATMVASDSESEIIDPTIEQLFENQLLMEGLHPNPTEMIPRIEELMQAATDPGPVEANEPETSEEEIES